MMYDDTAKKITLKEDENVSMYLASLNLGFIKELVTKHTVVGFIPTAGDVYDDPYFVREDRKRIGNIANHVIDIDVSNSSSDTLVSQINSTDLLFVAGGNTFYLMQQIREKGLFDIITNYVASDKIYIGASAGAAICSPSLMPYKKLDDPTKAPKLMNFNGLNLIDYMVLPHYGKLKYIPNYHQIMEEYSEQYRFVLLHDDEVMIPKTRTDYIFKRTGNI